MEQETMCPEEEKRNPSLEDLFGKIDTILARLQDQNVTLEESFSLYEKGMHHIRACKEMLDGIEQKMVILTAENQEDLQ